MDLPDTHGLGYGRVDDDPNAAVLLDAMDATGGWAATQRLRAWEREHLRLAPGERLLDVGCGLGDAALGLAADLAPDGEVVGIDTSAAMIRAATARASRAPCRARFLVGDAHAIDAPDASFDAVRSERTLQWLADPRAAVAGMVRVLRPGGRLSLIDTDWSTFAIEAGDDDLTRRVRDALETERGRPSTIGRRLEALAREAGLEIVAATSATQTWDAWDPDETPAPDGCFSMSSLADDLIDAGQLDDADRDRFVASIHAAAREGRFSMALTMYAVVAVVAEIALQVPDGV